MEQSIIEILEESEYIYRIGARHFVERHFVYCDTSSKVFVELPVRRKVTSSNAFLSNTTLSQIFEQFIAGQAP